MPQPLNAFCFSQPHWKVIAGGNDVERWLDEKQLLGTGGILMPQEVHLRTGQRYYRFASSGSPRLAQVGGGWWIGFENFTVIKQFAAAHGGSLSDAARLFLSLPYEWNRVDRLVSAILEVPLKAYSGKGKTVLAPVDPVTGKPAGKDPRDRDTNWTPQQHRAVTQLYIPGLVIKGLTRRPQLYESAFPHPIFEHIVNNRSSAPAPK